MDSALIVGDDFNEFQGHDSAKIAGISACYNWSSVGGRGASIRVPVIVMVYPVLRRLRRVFDSRPEKTELSHPLHM